MIPSMTDTAVKAAMKAITETSATIPEKIEMLIEIAQGILKKPKTADDLWNAVALYDKADELSQGEHPLLKARAKLGKANALRAIPDNGTQLLLQAKTNYQEALPTLQELASPPELAEAQMNLGLVLQSLIPFKLAQITECIQIYQQALQIFTYQKYPQEYAILHNNIAIAYLSMSTGSQQQYLYEGLAVQSFETALKHINPIEDPKEYAMLQNNLGNALQYLPSSNAFENNLRAVAAYDEALKIRNPQDTPLEYANTIANKANALINLPDNPEKPESGNPQNLQQAVNYYQEAFDIFIKYRQNEQAQVVNKALQELGFGNG